jgi:hypothetical protein
MDDSQQLKLRGEGLAWREVEGELVVLDLERSSYLSLNPTARLLWAKLQGGATVDGLVQELMTEFEVERSVAARDVEEFVTICRDQNLLES